MAVTFADRSVHIVLDSSFNEHSAVLSPDGPSVAFSQDAETEMVVGSPQILFEASYLHQDAAAPRTMYDVSPNGQWFLFIRDSPGAELTLRVVLNFDEELERLAPVED